MPDATPSDRPVPQNPDAERALLGSILLDNAAYDLAASHLVIDDFCSQAHRYIFEKMIALAEKRQVIDLVTLSEELAKAGLLEKAGGASYLSALTDGAPLGTMSAVEEYYRIIKEKSTIRRLINASDTVISHCLSGAEDAEKLIDLAQSQIFEIAEKGAPSGFSTLSDIVRDSFAKINVMFEQGQRVTGIETGLEDLDNMTSGLQPGELIVVAARPSLGKTALALNIAAHAAIKNRKTVGMFSLEMSKESLVIRLLCSEARIDSHKLRTGFSSKEDWQRMTPALGRLSEAPFYIDDSPSLSIMQIRSKARRMKAEKGLDLLIVDYLQLIAGPSKPENRNQEVSYISRNLKSIAKELKVPVLALSQLSRAPEQRTGFAQRPQLSDLRESGSIEQDADVVIFIYREKKAAGKGQEPEEESAQAGSETRLIIGKQRNGPTGDVSVVFLKPFAKFENKVHDGSESFE
jgi:replicative DNA helicase